jgi:transcriptional regulator with XRE-family HTH domain
MTDSIYFIQEVPDGAIKIGWTNKPVEERLRAMQIGNSRELKVVATRPGGRSDEIRLHMMFSDLRVRGEWFRPGRRLLNEIGLTEGILPPFKRVKICAEIQPIWSWMVENGVSLEELARRMGYKPSTLRQQVFGSFGGIHSVKMAVALEAATGGFFNVEEWQRKSAQRTAERNAKEYGDCYNPETGEIDHERHWEKFEAEGRESRRQQYEELRAEFQAVSA